MGYPKPTYDAAWQTLTRRRQRVQHEAAERRSEAYRRIPELRELERKIAQASTSVTKIVINEPDRAEELVLKLAEENLALQQKRRELLEQNCLPPDCLDEKYHCHICKDQGYASGTMCGCFARLLEQQAYAQLSKSAPVRNCTFSNFLLEYYSKQIMGSLGIQPYARMAETLDYCKKYAEDFSPNGESLLFMGNTGLGKTHLSLAIAGEVLAAGYGVIYTPAQKLLDTLEAEKFSRDSESRESYAENTRLVLACDLLVLDDLGTEFMTQFSHSVLYNIINTRLIESKPTIISTNLRIGEIEEKYSQRMVSRLVCGYRVMEFFGKDIRMVKMANRD